jgi:transcriptional regulator with XRE-family HTH domain
MKQTKLGTYLKELRESKSNTDAFSLRAVVSEINAKSGTRLTHQYLEQIESGGVKKPNPVTCLAIANYYRVPVKDLIKLMEED